MRAADRRSRRRADGLHRDLHRRVKGAEAPGKGLVWEAAIIRQLLYDAGTVSSKVVPILFSDGSPEHIPTPVKGWSRYVVDSEKGYESLYRRLTGQPDLPRPALGAIRSLPIRKRRWPRATREAASSLLNLSATQKTAEESGPMEPVSAIVGAFSAGAATFASGVLSEAGKNAYKRLKDALLRVVSSADLEKVEQEPNSENCKRVLT